MPRIKYYYQYEFWILCEQKLIKWNSFIQECHYHNHDCKKWIHNSYLMGVWPTMSNEVEKWERTQRLP